MIALDWPGRMVRSRSGAAVVATLRRAASPGCVDAVDVGTGRARRQLDRRRDRDPSCGARIPRATRGLVLANTSGLDASTRPPGSRWSHGALLPCRRPARLVVSAGLRRSLSLRAAARRRGAQRARIVAAADELRPCWPSAWARFARSRTPISGSCAPDPVSGALHVGRPRPFHPAAPQPAGDPHVPGRRASSSSRPVMPRSSRCLPRLNDEVARFSRRLLKRAICFVTGRSLVRHSPLCLRASSSRLASDPFGNPRGCPCAW